MQPEEPRSLLNVPALHAKHDVPPYPALHEQADASVLPVNDSELREHEMQADCLYDPAKHAEHSVPTSPSNPTAQLQRSIEALPVGETVFEGHARQLEPPAVPSHVPASHDAHDADPVTAL
eukprot:3939728-Rhodomonas_salina.1